MRRPLLPASLPAALRRQSGYTSVELLLVLALLGMFGGTAVPELIAARTAGNESAAVASLQATYAAQTAFRDGDLDQNGLHDFAPSLAVLSAATGTALPAEAQGYDFAIAAADATSFTATAIPVVPGVTGARRFAIDETGTVTNAAVGAPADTTAILGAATAVNQLSLGVARDQVRYLVHSDLNDIEILVLDTNGDGLLSFAEILDVDLLAAARTVQQHVHLSPGNVPIGDDATLVAILQTMQASLKSSLSLETGGEASLPSVLVSEPDDAADDYLGLVPEVSQAESLGWLHDLLTALNEQPFPAGDMPGKTVKMNQGRKRSLLRRTEALQSLLAAGRPTALGPRLRPLQARSDGNPHPVDWVAGEAAARILQQIDLSLRLVPPS
jgi:type II secretory pathway pseudopilin PulG